jgi:hypothetical protein
MERAVAASAIPVSLKIREVMVFEGVEESASLCEEIKRIHDGRLLGFSTVRRYSG